VHVDIHQHLWPEVFVEELRRRAQPPRLDGWTLLTSREPPCEVNPAEHHAGRRVAQAARDGVDVVVVGLSSSLGIDYLAPAEAQPLLDAYHLGVTELGAPFACWAAACLAAIDASDLAKQLDRGCVGLQLPATAVADESGYRRCTPLLDVLAERDLPLFIHPGPPAEPRKAVPAWWSPLVSDVQQLHAAWFAFRAYGRPAYPRLRVCFAALAGLAPLHGERLAAGGGTGPLTRDVVDSRMFVDTSSYGGRAVDSVLRVLGVDVLVFGSDRPYARPSSDLGLGEAAYHAIRVTNTARLLRGDLPPLEAGTDRSAEGEERPQ
jgi:hypothetical protein